MCRQVAKIMCQLTDNQNNYQKVSNPSCGNGTCWCVLVNGELVNALNATKYFPQKGRHGALYNFVEYKSLKSKSFERKIFLPSLKELQNIVDINDEYECDIFLETGTKEQYHMWLRDRWNNSSSGIHLNFYYRSVDISISSLARNVRPAMVLDLSKVSYTVK